MPYFMKQNVLEMSVTPCYLPVVHFGTALLTDNGETDNILYLSNQMLC